MSDTPPKAPDDVVERVAAAIFYERTDARMYHWPGDKPRKWRTPGGAVWDTTDYPESLARIVRKQARAAIAAMDDGWLPVDEHTPRDGTAIIAYLRTPWDEIKIVKWLNAWGVWLTPNDYDYARDHLTDERFGIGALIPTHWRPLPEPPA